MTKPNGPDDGLNGLGRYQTLYDEVDYSGDEEDDILKHILADNIVEDAPTFPLLRPPLVVLQEAECDRKPHPLVTEQKEADVKDSPGTNEKLQDALIPEAESSRSEECPRGVAQEVESTGPRRSDFLAPSQGGDPRSCENRISSQSRGGSSCGSREGSRVPSGTSSVSDLSSGERPPVFVSKAIEKLEFQGDLSKGSCGTSDLPSTRTPESRDSRDSATQQVRRSSASPASQSIVEVDTTYSRRSRDSYSWRRYEPEGSSIPSGAIGNNTEAGTVSTPPSPRSGRSREMLRGSGRQLDSSSGRRRRSRDSPRESRPPAATSTVANLVPLCGSVERLPKVDMPSGMGVSPANSDIGSERSGRLYISDSRRRDRKSRRRGAGDAGITGANLEPLACERTRRFEDPLTRRPPTSPASGRYYDTPSPIRDVRIRDIRVPEWPTVDARNVPRDDARPRDIRPRADELSDTRCREDRTPGSTSSLDSVRRTGANLEPLAYERTRRIEDPFVKRPRITDRLGTREDVGPSRLRQREHWQNVSREMDLSTPASANVEHPTPIEDDSTPFRKEHSRPTEWASTSRAGEKRGADVAGEKWGADVAGEKRGAEVAGEKRGANVAGEKRGADVAGEKRGTDVAGEKRGADVGLGEGWEIRREPSVYDPWSRKRADNAQKGMVDNW